MNVPHRTGWALKLALPAAFTLGLGGCATAPPPTAQMAVSQKAIDDAVAADAPQYSPVALKRAQEELDAARVALNDSHYAHAQRLAEAAQADADLAATHARSVKAQHAAAEVQNSIRALRDEIARSPQS
jgi:hypothetical protein